MYIPKSPLVLSIDLTNQCNLNCPHCMVNANSDCVSLSYEAVISIIDEAERIGIKEIVLGGGEPLIYEKFFSICGHILSKGLYFSFVTNGTLVHENINEFLKIRRYNKSFRVGISLDGYSPEMHGYFRPKETFESAINAICILNNMNISVDILCLLNRENIQDIPRFLKFISDLNILNIGFIPIMPEGNGRQYLCEMISPDNLYSILKEKQKWQEIFEININTHTPWEFLFLPSEERNPSPCEAGYLRLFIDPRGDIFPCAFLTEHCIGNIYHNSIKDVWLNSPILKKLRDPTLLKGACSICNYRNGCRGGCRGLAQSLGGDYLCADPYCPIVNQR